MDQRKDIAELLLPSISLSIPAGDSSLAGRLRVPENAAGLVILIHDKDYDQNAGECITARIFYKYKLATLSLTDSSVFSLDEKLDDILSWVRQNPGTRHLQAGYFAAYNDAAAILAASARHPELVRTMVLRGCDPGQAKESLAKVHAPVLLLVGGRDTENLRANRLALEQLNVASSLNVIPHASRAFTEPGSTEQAAQLAALWFLQHLEPL